MSTPQPETDRNITAFFGSRQTAEQAVSHLVDTGVPRDRILLRTGAARKAGCGAEDGAVASRSPEERTPAHGDRPGDAAEAVEPHPEPESAHR